MRTFETMLVVTAGTDEYRPIIEAQAKRCAEFGYRHAIYDLGGLGFGEKLAVPAGDLRPTYNQSLPPSTFKTDLMIKHAVDDGVVCWLDGDCIPLLPFEPDGDWDAAVTLRPIQEISRAHRPATRYLNSGVVWIRREALGFAQTWRRESVRVNTDQGGLNNIVGIGLGLNQWRQLTGKTVVALGGFRVKILGAMEWNCWHLPPKADTRILHFKREMRAAAKEYFRNETAT
jgi:hypothetical protein